MNNYAIGRRREYKTIALLERAGYECFRMAGSHGAFDVIGISPTDVVLCQVKNTRWPNREELETLKEFRVPANVRKLIHVWRFRQALPDVKEIT